MCVQVQPHPLAQQCPSESVLGAPEQTMAFTASLHARAIAVGLTLIYLPRMFPQQFWQLRAAEQTSWPLRMGIVLSKSSSSHSHISRNDNEKASEQIAA